MDSAGPCSTRTHSKHQKQGLANIRKWQRPITAQHQSIRWCAAETHRQAATERHTLTRHCFLWECTSFHFVFPSPEIAVSVTVWLKAYKKFSCYNLHGGLPYGGRRVRSHDQLNTSLYPSISIGNCILSTNSPRWSSYRPKQRQYLYVSQVGWGHI